MKYTNVHWISKVTGKYKIKIVILALIQAFLGGSNVLYAVLLKNVIDSASARNQTDFLLFFLAVIGLVVLQILLRAFVRWLEELLRSEIENILKSRLFETLLKKEYVAVTSVHSGEWSNRLTSDAKITADGIVEILPGIIGMLVKMTGAFLMLLVIEPKFMYFLIPGGATLMILTYAFRKILRKMHKTVQESDGKVRVFLQEHLSNLVIVKTFSAEEQTVFEGQQIMTVHKKARMQRNHFSNICNIGFSAAMNGMYLLGLGYCGMGIIRETVSYGTLTAVLQLISQIQSPFANITGYLPKFYAMTASAERLYEAEHFANDYHHKVIANCEIRKFYENDFYVLKMQNVSFSYKSNDRENTLNHVSFAIKKGENVAFMGHSGCGKSTILKLLMCLYRYDSGRILLQKSDGREIPLTSEWHRLFAYVPQGNQLMSGTIREIVSFAVRSEIHNEEKIKQALKISCADTFISELEHGIDTVLGEHGFGLSEGQMQRIAIARAIFSESPILLLDEATSALDEQTERKLLENLRSMTDKTVIIVTHRRKALEICDKIITITENKTEIEVRK